MKTLVIGSGAREHTLVRACLASPIVTEVIAAPGNGGMAQEVKCFPIAADAISDLVDLAIREGVNFVIVGPEVPLSLGLVDILEKNNIQVYGPNQKAARLESSKSFTKSFLKKYNIPTAQGESFTSSEKALEYGKGGKLPIVIKASGLAAGKGVIIAETYEEAEETIRSMLEGNKFGESGEKIVIEECLIGPEASIHLVVSGQDYVILPASQDHKRLEDNDRGPNTGGMGAFAPADRVTPDLLKEIEKSIIRPTLRGLLEEEIDFKGTLYIGLMLTNEGPKVLEFNVRFGDPETQVLLPLFESDPIELLHACSLGVLDSIKPKFKKAYAISIVQAAKGYPYAYKKGDVILYPETLPEGTSILHAGTAMDKDGDIVTNGGRVLSVCAIGSTLEEASEKAYELCEKVYFKDNYYRGDIAAKSISLQPAGL